MANASNKPEELSRENRIATDYAREMFEDGHNRTQDKEAPAYDDAAHNGVTGQDFYTRAAQDDANPASSKSSAAGLYDEEDGPIGGTEQELDDMEAAGTPVDRNPRMK